MARTEVARVSVCVCKSTLVCTSFTTPKMLLSRFLLWEGCNVCVSVDERLRELGLCLCESSGLYSPASSESNSKALRRVYAVACYDVRYGQKHSLRTLLFCCFCVMCFKYYFNLNCFTSDFFN